ncbi:peptidase [Stenotrophomonas maltophilia]|nr:peptidase [Stenotrophomonas maltophilia]
MNQPAAALQIFKAGTHVAEDGNSYTFTEDDVQQIAQTYSVDLHEAPIVVGHPKADLPAYGWGKALECRDGVLFAQPHQVDPDFASMVNKGRFKKISASIFLPNTPGNPTPGKFYLRHIGFLGAQPPAVKGLKSASFADGEEAVCFSQPLARLGWTLGSLLQSLRDYLIDRDGLETADKLIPQWQIREVTESTREPDDRAGLSPTSFAAPTDETTTETPMSQQTPEQIAQREQEIQTQTAALDTREKALAAREEAARREDAASFAEALVTEGKLLPRQKAGVVELLLAMPAGGQALNFAEGDNQVSKSADQVLRELLTAMPKAIDFSEKSGDQDVESPANFSAPLGSTVSPDRAVLFNKAKAYQLQHPGASWADAVAAVGG